VSEPVISAVGNAALRNLNTLPCPHGRSRIDFGLTVTPLTSLAA
jgi:hypothetical protein